ncbi:MAG: HNH endonuclease [bacterium]
MSYIPDNLRRRVIDRARSRCEYCGLAQEGQEATFHVDHVIPVSAGGETVFDNLALACVSCSLRKAARLKAVDPQTKKEVPLYNPRNDDWNEHFHWRGVRLVGLTATGNATVVALAMNRPITLAIREEEAAIGRHPRW